MHNSEQIEHLARNRCKREAVEKGVQGTLMSLMISILGVKTYWKEESEDLVSQSLIVNRVVDAPLMSLLTHACT